MSFNERKTLRIKWNKRQKWSIDSPNVYTDHVASDFINGYTNFLEFVEELKSHGYNTDTLKLSVNRRQFKCIKTFTKNNHEVKFQEGNIYFLSSIDRLTFSIVDNDDYIHCFNKYASDGQYVFDYFIEV